MIGRVATRISQLLIKHKVTATVPLENLYPLAYLDELRDLSLSNGNDPNSLVPFMQTETTGIQLDEKVERFLKTADGLFKRCAHSAGPGAVLDSFACVLLLPAACQEVSGCLAGIGVRGFLGVFGLALWHVLHSPAPFGCHASILMMR